LSRDVKAKQMPKFDTDFIFYQRELKSNEILWIFEFGESRKETQEDPTGYEVVKYLSLG
jgi:hypothetical protein